MQCECSDMFVQPMKKTRVLKLGLCGLEPSKAIALAAFSKQFVVFICFRLASTNCKQNNA